MDNLRLGDSPAEDENTSLGSDDDDKKEDNELSDTDDDPTAAGKKSIQSKAKPTVATKSKDSVINPLDSTMKKKKKGMGQEETTPNLTLSRFNPGLYYAPAKKNEHSLKDDNKMAASLDALNLDQIPLDQAIFIASALGKVDFLKQHIQEIPWQYDRHGDSALNFAICYDNQPAIDFFTKDITAQSCFNELKDKASKAGMYPLAYAVQAGNFDLIKFLLEKRGLRIMVPSYEPQTMVSLLHIALNQLVSEEEEESGTDTTTTTTAHDFQKAADIIEYLLVELFREGKYSPLEIYDIMNFQEFCCDHGRRHHLWEIAESLDGNDSNVNRVKTALDFHFARLRQRIAELLIACNTAAQPYSSRSKTGRR